MFFWSPRATWPPVITSAVLSTPSLSPVREDSLTFREKFSRMRPSATTMSPASSSTMSPGTTSAEGISTRTPPRSTLAVGEDMAFRLSRDFSAFTYCTVPRMALRMSTAKMTMVLSTFSDTAEIRAAMIRMITSRSLNCSRNTWRVLFFLPSDSLLGPYCSARRRTSASDRPLREAFWASRACWAVCL